MISLKGRNILINAGSTWVAIDNVRVITNIFKGKIGFTIALMATSLGANVTLLLGPSLDISSIRLPKRLRVVRFKYFNELDLLMHQELVRHKYDTVIHSAAISDFIPEKKYKGKLKSDVEELTIRLIPTKKIVDNVKKICPDVFLVKFKLEVGISTKKLIDIASKSLQKSNADLIVANTYDPDFTDHQVFIIDSNNNIDKVTGKERIAYAILKHISYERK